MRITVTVRPLSSLRFRRAVLAWLWRRLPGPVRRFLQARFGDVTRSEAWGYAVWGAMGVVVGVPEIWAAVAGSDFVWPTISTTVGHLQDRWPVVALVPVALIVIAGYSVFRFRESSMALQADQKAFGRTPQGRLVKQDVTYAELAGGGALPPAARGEWQVVPYFAFATIVVVSGSVVAAQSNNRFLVGYVLYSLIAVFWVIVPNAGAFWLGKDFPFTTLFFTVRCLGRRLQLVASVIAALLVILLLHLALYPWPSRP